jgi:hypothetical protein
MRHTIIILAKTLYPSSGQPKQNPGFGTRSNAGLVHAQVAKNINSGSGQTVPNQVDAIK